MIEWYDRVALVAIATACVCAVIATSLYPWSWRALGLGILSFLASVGILFMRGVANAFPRFGAHVQIVYYNETLWLVRGLLIVGAVGIVYGFARLIWSDMHDPDPGARLTGRAMARRFVVLVVVSALVWGALELAHRWRM